MGVPVSRVKRFGNLHRYDAFDLGYESPLTNRLTNARCARQPLTLDFEELCDGEVRAVRKSAHD